MYPEMRITIDQKPIDIPEGTTVLKAAELLGISIPTMCYMEGCDCHSSCMVCLVKDVGSGNIFPSCAMPARDGMNIQTTSSEIREMRRQALELLLGDHIGDCEAPCRLSCPAFMNIPLMNRLISGGYFTYALDIVREEIAIPLILGYICPAPCEKACHRKTLDEAVSICMLKRKTAQDGRLQPLPPRENSTGNERPVAVIGSGPAGLSAAFYLRRMGYDVTIYDKNPLPGGTLRYDIPENELPREALNREVETIKLMGVKFISGIEVDAAMFENEIVPRYKAIILATGNRDIHSPTPFSLKPDAQGNLVNRKTGATNRPGIFGCGSLITEQRMAVRSAAQGRLAALEADLFLNTGRTRRMRFQFHSAISQLLPGEELEYLKEAAPGERIHPQAGYLPGFSEDEAMKEAARCMHCDCRKPVTCRLRQLSDEYQANRKRFTGPERKNLKKYIRHDLIVYEPEKCIKCGRCVAITSQHKEELGLTFIGRGFDIRIGVPFGSTLQEGIKQSAFFCVEHCPTGALSFKDQEEGVEYGKRMRLTRDGWRGIKL